MRRGEVVAFLSRKQAAPKTGRVRFLTCPPKESKPVRHWRRLLSEWSRKACSSILLDSAKLVVYGAYMIVGIVITVGSTIGVRAKRTPNRRWKAVEEYYDNDSD